MIFDWKNPDYIGEFKRRADRLAKLRADPSLLAQVKLYYRSHLDDFINDWGVTVDPRVASKGRSPIMPLLLWPKQREYIQWLYSRWRGSDPGTVVKSRDVGISWLTMGFFVSASLFFDDVSFGIGSEKEDKIDRSGDPDCLFYKGRMFLRYLPGEFRGGFDENKHSAHMRIGIPATGSSITGEAGKNIGRGGRKSAYAVDESAFVPNPKAIDASLSANTDCRIDMSSVNGMSNSFAERAHNPDIPRFDFHFKDDPRKDDNWEKKKRAELDPVVFAAEYDCNFTASVDGLVIPALWVTAAIDAHKRLGIEPTGERRGAMDVADGGTDANAFAIGRDWLVEHVQSWRGSAEVTIFDSVEKAFTICDTNGLEDFVYDADGLGASVRGDAKVINEKRKESGTKRIDVTPFRGSGEVFDPERIVPRTERKAEDFFENIKAQSWWLLRYRFEYTHSLIRRLNDGEFIHPDEIDRDRFISIAKDFPERARFCIELSQPIWMMSKRGKLMVDKCPVGTKTEVRQSIKSPNLADSGMMLFAPRRKPIAIHPSLRHGVSGNASRTR